ncbi:MAG: DNA/RNA nuclease SfsA [Angelakisella sp.]|nr:DNA/RNA nuclease SfsA [Angelakisella sp.]
MPSSCRLSNFVELSNRQVILRPIKKKNARTKYSVYAFRYRQSYVPLNLSSSNVTIENNLRRRMFAFLGSRNSVFREKTIDGYKSDLYIADSDTIVEIKSILSFNRTAQFPTVFSERANRQLEDLMRLLKNGHKVCYMLVSMYYGVKQININEQQEEYCWLFRECVNNGMTVCAFSFGMKESEPFVKARIDVRV